VKIELHKQLKVPIDGLMPIAEEISKIINNKEKKKASGPYEEIQSDNEIDDNKEEKEKLL
jgi:hypothetical protein